jgi:DNA-binding response OmpR family regulator
MSDLSKNGPAVLVVEDEPNELKALLIGLELEGFQVVGASSGAEALARLGEVRYAIALIDLMLPETNGIQLAREVKLKHPDVATILMSAYHLSPVQLARADTGAVGFVPKPFRFDELVQFIRTKVDPRQSQLNVTAPGTDRERGMTSPFDVPETAG